MQNRRKLLPDIPDAKPEAQMAARRNLLSDIPDAKAHDLSQLPFPLNIGLGLGASAAQPLSKTIPERLAAAKQGLLESSQGLGQLYLGGKEALGYAPLGIKNLYTQRVMDQRRQFEEGQKTFDPLSQYIRKIAASWPELAAASVPFAGEASLLPRMLKGAGAMGAAKGLEFTPPGEDTTANVIKGAALGATLPVIPEIPGLLEKGIGKVAGLKNAWKDLSAVEKAASEKTAQYQADLAAENQAKSQARAEGLPSDVNALQAKSLENQTKLQELQHNLGEKPVKIPSSIEESQANLANAEQKHKQAIMLEDQAARNISEHLNRGASHDVRVAAGIDKVVREKAGDIGKLYDQVETDLANKNITIPNTDNAKELNDQIIALIRSGEVKSPEALATLERLNKVGKDEVIPARDYLAAFRTTRDYAHEARKEAYRVGITDEARQAAFKRAEELEHEVERMKPILEEGIGKETTDILKKANARWSSEIAPIYRNKTYNRIKFEGTLPDNIMKTLRGTAIGRKELREIIKKDPELLKNVVGQQFAKSPSKLHDIGELEQEYVDQMPELKNLLEQHKQTREMVPQAKRQFEEAQKSHSVVEKEHKAMIEEAEKRPGKLKEIHDLHDKIAKIDSRIAELRKSANRKNMSLPEKMKAEKELRDAINLKKKSQKSLKGMVIAGALLTGVPYAAYKAGRYLLSD